MEQREKKKKGIKRNDDAKAKAAALGDGDVMLIENVRFHKEEDKCPPNQTKQKEVGSLPEKEFRIITVKMIQNLENKMELQINSLETRTGKMQEMFNKDLEEIKKSQSIMNNAITEVKTL